MHCFMHLVLCMQITSTTPDGFTPVVVKQTKDYLYAEYTSPIFGVS